MKITKEYLQQEIERLNKREEVLLAEANAVSGARAELETLVSYLEQPETPATKEKDE